MSNYDKYLKYKRKYLELKRFQQGGQAVIPSFNIFDDIFFWARQSMEHSLIFRWGFNGANEEGQKLAAEAQDLLNQWSQYLKRYYYDKGVQVTPEKVFLTEDEINTVLKPSDRPMSKRRQEEVEANFFSRASNRIREYVEKMRSDFSGFMDMMGLIGEVYQLIEKMEDYVNRVVAIQDSGKWIGLIYPSLTKHILKETQYFKRFFGEEPGLTPDEEIQFIKNHHQEEMGATAQLIDPAPDQQTTIDVVRSYALIIMSALRPKDPLTDEAVLGQFPKEWSKEDENILKGMDAGEQATLLALSIRYSQELTDFAQDTGVKIESNQLKSVISSVLAHHVHREFARFTVRLRMLAGETVPGVPIMTPYK